jgi:hypothetical protein
MSLEVIGAGFGRTGTLSLKYALQKLGFDACYHMIDVLQTPGHAAVWSAAADGQPVDWDALFAGYRATVDWPGAYFWRELTARYPEAKVILSVRPAEAWYRSARDTIFGISRADMPAELPGAGDQHAMAEKVVWGGTFGGRFEDKAHAIDVYEKHNAEVKRTIPADRLLVYEPGQGWEPLCRFLNRPIPDEPYPHVNTTEEFNSRLKSRQR